ncbi:MAG: hypothetical protein KDK12_13855 [Rhodobacteraceae bacterium]|nr:hypothetical protein [Paracoccaceae bacterium]
MTRAINWGLPLLTLASYLYLAIWLGRQLGAESGGLMPFDLRITGYDLHAVRDYLRALTPAGYALYQGPIRVADTVFPALMGLTFLWWMRPLRGGFGMVSALSAMAYTAIDWGENLFIQRLLQAGPDYVDASDASGANAFTLAKFAVYVLAAVLAARASWRRVRG